MSGSAEQVHWHAELQNAMRELPRLSYAQNMTIGDVWGKRHWSTQHEIIHVRHGRARIDIGANTAGLRNLCDILNIKMIAPVAPSR